MPPPTEFSPLDERREGLLREAMLSSGISGSEEEETGIVRSFLVFLSGSEWCAADLANIRRVLRPASIARVSGAAPEVLGVMNYQGEVLCVLDLQRILGTGSCGHGREVHRGAALRREGGGFPRRLRGRRLGASLVVGPSRAGIPRPVAGADVRGDGDERRPLRRPAVSVDVPEPVTSPLEILLLDVGDSVRGYDFRDVLCVKEDAGESLDPAGRFVVSLGRLGPAREVRCREVLGSRELSACDIRPVPEALCERMEGEKPWAVGITGQGICLLY